MIAFTKMYKNRQNTQRPELFKCFNKILYLIHWFHFRRKMLIINHLHIHIAYYSYQCFEAGAGLPSRSSSFRLFRLRTIKIEGKSFLIFKNVVKICYTLNNKHYTEQRIKLFVKSCLFNKWSFSINKDDKLSFIDTTI